jgi:recombinational DNA repair ATPase RecF
MKIIQFNAENVKKLKAVEIKPSSYVVEISGKNESGKTSLLDAIYYALGGKEALKSTTKPIRSGEKSAKIKLDLGDIVVERRFTEKDSYLSVTTKEGAKFPSPQALLDSMVGRISFDPLAFANMDNGSADGKRRQLEDLISLVKLDIDLVKWQKDRQDLVDTRGMLGRNIKDAESQLKMMATVPDNIPEEEISISQLTEEFKTAQDIKTANDAKRKLLSDKRGEAEQLQTEILTREKTINSMKANLKELEDAQLNAKNTLSVRIEHGKTLKAEVDTLQDPDMDAITSKMSGVEENNRMVRIKAKRKETEDVLAREKKSYNEKTAEIDALDKKKSDALKSAKFPIANLSFNDEGVLYKDIPFSQCSSAERLKVSLAIAMAMNPKVRVIRITDGSLLDADNMKIIADMAKEKDFQCWIERVSSDDQIGIVIEDGTIVKNNYEKKGKTNE